MQTYISGPLETARRYWRMSLVRGIVAIIFGLLAIFWPHLTYALLFYVFGVFAIIEGCLLIANGFSQSNASSQRVSSFQQTGPSRGESYQQGYQRTDSPTQRGASYQAGESTQREAPSRRDTGYQQGESTPRNASYRRDTAYQQGEPAQRGTTSQGNATHRYGFGGLSHLYGARAHHANPKTLMLIGAASVICGILCLVLPGVVGALAVYAIAAWALFEGIGFLMQIPNRGWVMGLIGVLAIILALVLFFNPLGAIRSFLWIIGLFSLLMGCLLVVRGLAHRAVTGHMERPLEPGY